MSESKLIADFCGRIITEDVDQLKPIKARVLLNREQLVLVTGDGKEAILLSNIASTDPGMVLESFSQFFEEAIAIAYRQNGTQKRAVIGGSSNTVAKFRTRLYKLLIGEQTVLVKHPAKRGGRVTNAPALKMTLEIDEDTILLVKDDQTAKIHLEAVIGFEHERRQFGDKQRLTLTVDHAPSGTTLTTYISLPKKQHLTFLSQFIRQNYSKVVANVNDIHLSETEIQLLASLHTFDGGAKQDRLMLMVNGVDDPDSFVEQLREKQLVTHDQDELHLTYRGEIMITEQVESVNE
jgi:helix-turn-helix protein